MKETVNMRNAAALQLRGIKELHKVSPKFFPLLTVYSIFSAITPYVTVFFSAQILKELATLRREENLWQWVIAGVLCVGIAAIAKAMLYRRYNSLLNDLYGRKEILFIHKMFSLDFSELDKQENHDLRAQIQQNEDWSSWGLMRVEEAYIGAVSSVIGLLSGIALTVSLFTSPVPESGYLDTEHIEWLTTYLQNYENAFILVSHDIPFLNRVVNVIYHVENAELTRYKGSYDDFLKMYEIRKKQQEAAFTRQQQEIDRLEDFIARNKARVATRGMANSRQKWLDKMEVIEKPLEKPKPKFSFREARTPWDAPVSVFLIVAQPFAENHRK